MTTHLGAGAGQAIEVGSSALSAAQELANNPGIGRIYPWEASRLSGDYHIRSSFSSESI